MKINPRAVSTYNAVSLYNLVCLYSSILATTLLYNIICSSVVISPTVKAVQPARKWAERGSNPQTFAVVIRAAPPITPPALVIVCPMRQTSFRFAK